MSRFAFHLVVASALLVAPLEGFTRQSAPTLRRSTAAPLGDCTRDVPDARFTRADALLNRITRRITAASNEVFQGDLAPAHVCIRTDIGAGNRAWANVENRSAGFGPALLHRTQNEAQVAWTVAHELAHITTRQGLPEGHPVGGEAGRQLTDLIRRANALALELDNGTINKNDATYQRKQAERESINSQINRIYGDFFGAASESWKEVEADDVALYFYLRAGYSPAEVGWRSEQEVIARAANLDPHSPPSAHSSAQREVEAARICGITATSPEPSRGPARYADPCWTLWSLKYRARQSADVRSLFARASTSGERAGNVMSEELRVAQAEIRAVGCDQLCNDASPKEIGVAPLTPAPPKRAKSAQ